MVFDLSCFEADYETNRICFEQINYLIIYNFFKVPLFEICCFLNLLTVTK